MSTMSGAGRNGGIAEVARFLERYERVFVLTGAGVSTRSGIPDYRDADGNWKRRPPVQFGPFVRDRAVRKRYWARSMLGWPHFAASRPGSAHAALATLEKLGKIEALVTQNVDGLHQRAGSDDVLDLHGRLDTIVCLGCRDRRSRAAFQEILVRENPDLAGRSAPAAPDGDADLEDFDPERFRVPDCDVCGGTLKPDVVFFGESVPKARVAAAFAALARSDAVLVVGSSLMIWSGYRFARAAVADGKPVAAVNLGRTRADDDLAVKVEHDCGAALSEAARQLEGSDRR